MEDSKNFSAQRGHCPPYGSPLKGEAGGQCPSRRFYDGDGIALTLSDEVFFLFSELISRTSGITLGVRKKELLVSRLLKRLKLLGITQFYPYYQRVKNDPGELIQMLNCITTHTTKFFREEYHFEYLTNVIIPDLIKKKQSARLRIWSAGCSTGEEPYSIAISVCEAFLRANEPRERWDIRILATDISTSVLETARSGIYECEQIPETMHADITGRYFLRGVGENRGKVMLKDGVKRMIRFRRLNLKEKTYPFANGFDIIFCRNVMIYFDEEMKQHLISQFSRHLHGSGYLFLGHSETMVAREQFVPVYVTLYRKP
jgi:chemotaxis protein methyltransferase CheR